MTQRLASYFNDYAEYHRTPGNQICHFVGIPLIACSLLGLLSLVTFGADTAGIFRLDLGLGLVILGVLFYLTIDWKITLPFTLVLLGMYFLGRTLPLSILIAMQVVGWIAQYIGHLKYEHKNPAFYQNLTHIMIGPLWIFAKCVGYGKAPGGSTAEPE